MRRPAILGGPPAFPRRMPLVSPTVPPLERVMDRLRPSYDRGVLTNGPLVRTLEEEAASRLAVRHVVAVSSCTSGLMLAIRSVERQGSAVLPSFTFSASAHAVAWNGLRPVFAECDPSTFQLDVDDAAGRLDEAGLLLATHVFGAPCTVEAVEDLGRSAGVPVIFDAAHAFGASRRGRPVGGFGRAEVFSLSPTKPLVAAEGGLIATNDDGMAEAARMGRDYGNPGDYDTRFVGLNARLSELHAALAIESLAQLDENLERRRSVARRYRDGLADIVGLAPQEVDQADRSTYKDFTLTVDEERFGLSRDAVARSLGAEGIDTRPYFFPPVHRQQAYRGAVLPDLPVTDRTASRVISLPMFPGLAPGAVDRICDVLTAVHGAADEVRALLSAC